MKVSRQIASLSIAKSTEPHDHDSYSDQTNAIGVMRKPSNYNPYSNTYNPGWRDHPIFHGLKDSNRTDQQLQLHQFHKILKPLNPHLDHTIITRTTLNRDHGRIHFRISRMLLTPQLSNKTAPLMDYEMSWEHASTHKLNQFQASRRWWDSLLLQFRIWQRLLRKVNFQVNQCLILKVYMKQVLVHHSSMERSKQSWPCEKERKSTTKWRCRWQKKIKLYLWMLRTHHRKRKKKPTHENMFPKLHFLRV